MAGVRIQHATERGVTYVLVDGSRPYAAPIVCLVCGVTHVFKTYHIALDGTGASIVSPEIVERLKALGPQTGFSISNEVKKPPKQGVGFNGAVELGGMGRRIIINPHLKEPH